MGTTWCSTRRVRGIANNGILVGDTGLAIVRGVGVPEDIGIGLHLGISIGGDETSIESPVHTVTKSLGEGGRAEQ